MARPLIIALSLVGWLGCKEKGPERYPTYQECFDDLTIYNEAKLPVEDAIVECCLDHPIADIPKVCGQSKPDCINYLTENLKQTSAGVDQMANACQTYIDTRYPPME